MEKIRVKREELLTKLKENRANHRSVFEKAQVIYREQMVAELDRMLADAKAGHKIVRAFALPEPEDHTNDYDRVITMMEMSVDTVIEMGEAEFGMYVMDHWAWERSFASNTSSYVSQNRS